MALIHPTAIIDPSAQLAEDVEVGAYSIIGEDVQIGRGTRILAHAHILPHTRIGERNEIHMGAVIGHDPQFVGFDRSTVSYTILGNENVIREYVTIHRGIKPGSETRIGNQCFIMACAHIAHDCRVGNQVILANYAGFSGHVEVGDRVFCSGYAGFHQFVRVGTMAMISGQTRVSRDVPPYTTCVFDCRIIGLNTVGLRRGGVKPETRLALAAAYKAIFRSGLGLTHALEKFRTEWGSREMPPELAHFLEFCATPSKRGLGHPPRAEHLDIQTEDL